MKLEYRLECSKILLLEIIDIKICFLHLYECIHLEKKSYQLKI